MKRVLASIFLLYVVYFSGIFTLFKYLAPAFPILFCLCGVILAFGQRHLETSIGWRHRILEFERVNQPTIWQQIGTVFIALAPLLILLGGTVYEEFPYSGDHFDHLRNGREALSFWQQYAAYGLVHLCGTFLLRHSRYLTAWVSIGYLGLYALSRLVPTPYAMVRYPGLGLFLGLPFNALIESTGMAVPWFANRMRAVSSVCIWLVVLRPLFLGRWPGFSLLLFSAVIFYQPDLAYLFTSGYLEPWAAVLVLMACETALRAADAAHARYAIYWIGAAACVKEQAILMLPCFALLAVWPRQPLRSRLAGFVAASSAAVPFIMYYIARTAGGGNPRSAQIASLKDAFQWENVEGFLTRSFLQWQINGTVLLVLMAIIFIAFFAKANTHRTAVLVVLASALSVAGFFFLDANSRPWLGYPRFNLIPVIAVLSIAIPAAEWLMTKSYKAYAAIVIAALALNAVSFQSLARRWYQPEILRDYFEHMDMPVYFPVRRLVQIANDAGLMDGIEKLHAFDRGYYFSRYFAETYPDLGKRYQLSASLLKGGSARCLCQEDDQALFVPAFAYVNTRLGDTQQQQQEDEFLSLCRTELLKTCRHVVSDSAGGYMLGLLGIGRLH